MKDEKLLDELKSRLDIVDLISEYVELRRAGQNYKGLCPFHSEKTPSFMVSPEKQIFHCFGCGAGGDIIHFVMKYDNLSFQESLTLLAKKAGIKTAEYRLNAPNDGIKEKLLEIQRVASKVFGENLGRSKTAYEYLKGRGLTDETIRTFSLGYALRDWHHLSNYLKAKGYPGSLTVQSGLVSSGEKGVYDTFRDRIMFPITNVQADLIAFGGRVMDDGQPKYLNSQDSPLFRKGETLYGLSLAKDAIRKKGHAIITEGYFDVVMCHQYGFENAVAPLGTALTAGHLQKLKRFTRKVIVVFDGDDAGISAARRSIPLLLEQAFVARILLLPEKDDPDSFLRRKGKVAFSGLLGKASTEIDFILKTSRKEKAETIREAAEIVSSAGDMILKESLIRELAERSEIRETIIREELKRMGKRPMEGGRAKSSPPSTPALCYDEELLLLSAVLASPERLDDVLEIVPAGEFGNSSVRNIFEKLHAGRGKKGLRAVLSSLGEEEKALVAKLTFHPGLDREMLDKNIEDCIRRIHSRKICERHLRIHEQIKQAEVTGKHELLVSLLKERQKLMREAK